MRKIAIVGGGAAGFMAAITARQKDPACEVVLLEKTQKLLNKVKVSGGGRCNVTNAETSIPAFAGNYPRGEKQLKKAFSQFSSAETIRFFEEKGVKLKAEPDGRVFPVTNSSQTIIDCLLKEASAKDITIKTGCAVERIQKVNDQFHLTVKGETLKFDRVLIATGGSPKLSGFTWLSDLGHHIVSPVPSLFTFNMPGEAIKTLQGLVVQEVKVRIVGSKLSAKGPLLITHWGMSGPSILKLSSWGARFLSDLDYQFSIAISWIDRTENEVRMYLFEVAKQYGKRKFLNVNPFGLPQRMWEFLADKAGLNHKICGECGKKDFNKLTEVLINDVYMVEGKTTYKEEFVTCGGISLTDVDFATLESRVCPGLYFAGEVLDIDGITGGFNFQAAWTTGYIAGRSMAEK